MSREIKFGDKMTDCQNCKHKDDCVNVGKFKDGDCLQFKKEKK